MKKVIARLLSVCVCVFLIAGCSGGAGNAPANNTPAAATTAAAENTAAAQDNTAAAATQDNTAATPAQQDTASSGTPSYVNATGYPIPAQDIPAMTMLVSQAENQKPANELNYYIEMEKLTGVKWTYIQPPSSGYADQMNLMMSSNNLPDVINTIGNGPISMANQYNWGVGGLIIPLEKLIADYGPNFQALMKRYPEIPKSITSADGHIYTMPNVNNSPKEIQRLWINYNWSTKWGMTKYNDEGVYYRDLPTTLDEFYNLLVRFRDEDPNGNGQKDELPLSLDKDMFGGTAGINSFSPTAVILSYFGLIGKGISEENGKIIFTSIDNRYKEYLKFMHKLFVEQLLDNESFTQDGNQLTAKGKANLIGVTGGWNAIAYQYSEGSDLDKLKGTSMPPLTSQFSTTAVYPLFPMIRTGCFAITKACKYPEVAYRWVDIGYSGQPEDVLRLFWGGQYTWLDESTKLWQGIVPEGQSNAIRTQLYTNGSDTDPPYFADTATLDHQGGITGVTDRYKLADAQRFVSVARSAIPVISFTPDELSSIASYGPDIYTYCDQMEAAFITGTTDIDGGWDEYVNNLQKMNLSELVNVYQTGYDRFTSN